VIMGFLCVTPVLATVNMDMTFSAGQRPQDMLPGNPPDQNWYRYVIGGNWWGSGGYPLGTAGQDTVAGTWWVQHGIPGRPGVYNGYDFFGHNDDWGVPLVSLFDGPLVHGIATIKNISFSSWPEDNTIILLQKASSYMIEMAPENGDIWLVYGGNKLATIPVVNNNGQFHDYGWELDTVNNRVKVFFDGLQVGNLAGYYAGGSGVSASDVAKFGDATSGLAHEEVWDRYQIMEGAYPAAFLLGDANGDHLVSADDYASVQANFSNSGVPGIPGDANHDGVVSADDYASVQANFGNHLPEPATIGLLAMGLMAVFCRRSK